MKNEELIKKITVELLQKMVNEVEVSVSQEDSIFLISIKTQDEAPTIIGRHGETIRALQKILEVVIFKQIGEPVDIIINVNDYREKQTERLEYIAKQAVEKVKDRQSATYLRGFSSYERRIMHEYISKNFKDLKSFSIGEGRDRRLVVDLSDSQSFENDRYSEEESSKEDDFKIEV